MTPTVWPTRGVGSSRRTFAWIFRYPGELEDPPVEEVVEALAMARDVHNAALARLPTEVWRTP